MSRVFIFLMLFLCLACKRNYKCSCAKTDANLDVVDEATFTVKAKDSKQGYQACLNKYIDMNPAPGTVGEISCEVK